MKKIFTVLIALVITLSLTACLARKSNEDVADKSTQSQQDSASIDKTNTEIKHTGVKLEGLVIGASEYSEGLAFACTNDRVDKVYCITKEGYIVFEIDVNKNASSQKHKIDAKFINGFALFDNVIYDYTGKAIYPEDVGAEVFYDIAFEGKYILASTFDYESETPKCRTGVLDFNLQWVVPLSETFYDTVGESLAMYSPYNSSYSVYYCAKDCLYTNINKMFVNLRTGKVTTEPSASILSSQWLPVTYNTSYVTYDSTTVLTLKEIPNIYRLECFVNGKAPVIQYDAKSDTASFFMINEKGEQLFDAISLQHKDSQVVYDGKNTILVTTSHTPTSVTAKTYSINGEYIASFDTDTLQTNSGVSVFTIRDEVILVITKVNDYSDEAYYFTKDFTPLF